MRIMILKKIYDENNHDYDQYYDENFDDSHISAGNLRQHTQPYQFTCEFFIATY